MIHRITLATAFTTALFFCGCGETKESPPGAGEDVTPDIVAGDDTKNPPPEDVTTGDLGAPGDVFLPLADA
ncbi:MAG: hypothetical protein VX938_09235, partial [Myxococcota bacterium]|nr:hypothetical protein [Myxococcota bacterium]